MFTCKKISYIYAPRAYLNIVFDEKLFAPGGGGGGGGRGGAGENFTNSPSPSWVHFAGLAGRKYLFGHVWSWIQDLSKTFCAPPPQKKVPICLWPSLLLSDMIILNQIYLGLYSTILMTLGVINTLILNTLIFALFYNLGYFHHCRSSFTVDHHGSKGSVSSV